MSSEKVPEEIIRGTSEIVLAEVASVLRYFTEVSENVHMYISALMSVGNRSLLHDILGKAVHTEEGNGWKHVKYLISYADDRALAGVDLYVSATAALLSVQPPLFPHMNVIASALVKEGYTPVMFVRKEPVLEGIIPFIRAPYRIISAMAHTFLTSEIIEYVASAEAQIFPLPLDLFGAVKNTARLWYTSYGLSEMKRTGAIEVNLEHRPKLPESELSEFRPLTEITEVIKDVNGAK